MRSLYLLIAFIVSISCLVFCSCKKSNDNPSIFRQCSFEYQGQVYNCSDEQWSIIERDEVVAGIIINRPDLFGGTIRYEDHDCAFLIPAGDSILVNPGCMLTYDDGSNIDSSKVYLYQSGTLNYTTSNCKEGKMLFIGGYIYYDVCDVEGNFTLNLVNDQNEDITLSKGIFKASKVALF
jgi:hypothetical protein